MTLVSDCYHHTDDGKSIPYTADEALTNKKTATMYSKITKFLYNQNINFSRLNGDRTVPK